MILAVSFFGHAGILAAGLGGRGIGSTIARALNGEPGAIAELVVSAILIIGVALAVRWWIKR